MLGPVSVVPGSKLISNCCFQSGTPYAGESSFWILIFLPTTRGRPLKSGLPREFTIPTSIPPTDQSLWTSYGISGIRNLQSPKVDILHKFSSTTQALIYVVLFALRSFLKDPNPFDSLEPDIAHVYQPNRARSDGTARELTRKYAM